MSSEYMAERILDLVADHFDESDPYAEENVRSGGHFFTVSYRGRHYEIEVVEVTSR